VARGQGGGTGAAHASSNRRPRGRWQSSWLIGTTVRRTRAQWRLLAAVLGVAVLSGSLVTSLGLLVTATEQGGVRGALNAIPPDARTMGIRVLQPSPTIDAALESLDGAVATVLGDGASATSTSNASTGLESVPGRGELPTLTWFGERDGITDNATLVDGSWPEVAATGISVALPSAAASSLGLTTGSTFVVDTAAEDFTVTISGIYDVDDPTAAYWDRDFLHGRGNDTNFANPGVGFYQQTHAFGPLVSAPGGLDAAGIPVAYVDVDYLPEFGGVTVAELQPLLDRLDSADLDIPSDAGRVGTSIFYDSDVAKSASTVAASLIVTRSTVVVVSLLMLVLAVAAMAQTARLFTDARSGERALMRSRGASARHVLALAAVEASGLALATAALSPPLAALVYRAIAAQPPMVAAGMPLDVGIPPIAWLTAGAVAVVLALVLIAPLLSPARSFVEGEQAKGRQRAASGIARSGVDVALVALAALAFWQLQSYRTPVGTGASLSVDPVLAAGPALVLLAAALVSARLIPAVSRLVDRVGSGSRGIGVSLAAWEVGRRSQRATAAVLLLSLTLAVGTFGLAFLETWKQSQVDQASVALGPPARVPADAGLVAGQAHSLREGAIGQPEPVMRRTGVVGSASSGLGEDSGAAGETQQILALTRGARQLLDRARTGETGGSTIADAFPGEPEPASGFTLPEGAVGISATVAVDEAGELGGVTLAVSAVLEDATGLITPVSLGEFVIDGAAHPLRAALPIDEGAVPAEPLRVIGFQYAFSGGESAGDEDRDALADIVVTALAGLQPQDGESLDELVAEPVADGTATWFGIDPTDTRNPPAEIDVSTDSPVRMSVVVPASVHQLRATFALVGWMPVTSISAIVSTGLADSFAIDGGTPLTLLTRGVSIRFAATNTVSLVPGAATSVDLTAVSAGLGGSASSVPTMVVDQVQFARALVQQGVTDATVDEWWVDVAPATAVAYGAEHPGSFTAEQLGLALQQAPLRVATQAALWLAIAAGAALAAVGFAVHSVATLRARRLEFAQLRAIGFSRRRLVGLIAGESLLMTVLGAIFGVSIGLLLVWLVGPLVAVSPSGAETVPEVIVQVPWLSIGLLVVELGLALGLVVLLVARGQRFAEPAELLREGSSS